MLNEGIMNEVSHRIDRIELHPHLNIILSLNIILHTHTHHPTHTHTHNNFHNNCTTILWYNYHSLFSGYCFPADERVELSTSKLVGKLSSHRPCSTPILESLLQLVAENRTRRATAGTQHTQVPHDDHQLLRTNESGD